MFIMESCWDARIVTDHTTQPPSISRRQKIRGSKSSLNVSNADQYFRYSHKYKVLICLEHATGIQNLNSHLRDYHTVPAKERKAIVEKYSGATIEKADQVRLPLPMGQPIEELGEPKNGFQCIEADCDYISINKDVFRRHCKDKHTQKWTGNTSELYVEVRVQTFFPHGGLQRYFVVNNPDNNIEPSAPAKVQDEVNRLLAR